MYGNMRRRFFDNNIKNFDINNYLTIEALDDNLQIYFPYEDLMYGIDGVGWQKLTAGQYSPPINTGQTISFKGNVSSTISNTKSFTITKRCNLIGNCMSLTSNDIPTFHKLFVNCANIVYISNDFLPATILASSCYSYMFYGCTSLTTAPELPATILANSCYDHMFEGCTSLTTAPELPATTLADHCYDYMFYGCTSLTTAPELPATTLADGCYSSMFEGCTSLTTSPDLPATTLTSYCYERMFEGCTSLTTSPDLPATVLASGCYWSMFRGCSKLNYIKAMFTTVPSSDYTYKWVEGVASSGTFIKNKNATWNVTNTSGIPPGWTVQTA